MRVLAVESSCDETAVAVYEGGRGLLAERVYTQTDLHEIWGGVVPELASRDHVRRLAPMIVATLADAALERQDIDGVAYTAGPGLIGALLVGAGDATGLAYAWKVPVIGIHHLEVGLNGGVIGLPYFLKLIQCERVLAHPHCLAR